MIFKQWHEVLDGTKSQTRRLRFPYELAVQLWKHGWSLPRPYAPYTWADWQNDIGDVHIAEANRILAEQYVTLPVKPHRTAKSIGRIHAMRVRREQLQDITPRAAKAEGVDPYIVRPSGASYIGYEQGFVNLWDSINKKPGMRWDDNPSVWALTFEALDGRGTDGEG